MITSLTSVLLFAVLGVGPVPLDCPGVDPMDTPAIVPLPPVFPPDVTPPLTGLPTDTTPSPRPPGPTTAGAPSPSGPTTAKPIPGLPTFAPVTGRRRRAVTYASWEVWWELNRDRFLLPRQQRWQEDWTQDDGFFLGRGHRLKDRKAVDIASIRGKLAELLKADDIMVREHAVIPYGHTVRSAEDLAPLVALLDDEHHHVRERAALALGLSKQPEARATLEALLRDDEEGRQLEGRSSGVSTRTRTYAAVALGLLGQRESIHVLLEIIRRQEGPSELVGGAVSALGLMGAEARTAVPWLVRLLDEKALPVGAQASIPEALGKIGDLSGRPVLERVMRDPKAHRLTRAAALTGYGRMMAGSEDEGAIEQLQRIVRLEGDSGLRRLAAMALGSVGGSEARDELIRALRADTGPDDRAWLCLALGVLQFERPEDEIARQVLRDIFVKERNGTIRSAIALALGIAGDRRAATAIETAVVDSRDRRLQALGSTALGMLGSSSSRGALFQVLAEESDRHPRVDAATALWLLADEEAAPKIARAMTSATSAYDRKLWTEALGSLRHPDGATALIELVKSRSKTQSSTVAQAAIALGKLAEAKPTPALSAVTLDSNSEGTFDFVREIAALR